MLRRIRPLSVLQIWSKSSSLKAVLLDIFPLMKKTTLGRKLGVGVWGALAWLPWLQNIGTTLIGVLIGVANIKQLRLFYSHPRNSRGNQYYEDQGNEHRKLWRKAKKTNEKTEGYSGANLTLNPPNHSIPRHFPDIKVLTECIFLHRKSLNKKMQTFPLVYKFTFQRALSRLAMPPYV